MPEGNGPSYNQRTGSMVALARNFNFLRSCFLTGLAAVFVARLNHALAWQVCTLTLFTSRHNGYPVPSKLLVSELKTLASPRLLDIRRAKKAHRIVSTTCFRQFRAGSSVFRLPLPLRETGHFSPGRAHRLTASHGRKYSCHRTQV